MELASVPEWLAAALLAAALATLGYVGKQMFEWVAGLRTARRVRRARLVTLLSLLQGTSAIFRVQANLRDRLFQAVIKRTPELADSGSGYEAVFCAALPTLTTEERELHNLIRGYTVNGLKPLNEAMMQWLQTDTEFKLARSRKKVTLDLACKLGALEPHVLMWLAKYAAWIPDTPAHALVYLGDEEGHGVPFPKGIEGVIEQALSLKRPGCGQLLNAEDPESLTKSIAEESTQRKANSRSTTRRLGRQTGRVRQRHSRSPTARRFV